MPSVHNLTKAMTKLNRINKLGKEVFDAAKKCEQALHFRGATGTAMPGEAEAWRSFYSARDRAMKALADIQ